MMPDEIPALDREEWEGLGVLHRPNPFQRCTYGDGVYPCPVASLVATCTALEAERDVLREALVGMVLQFAHRGQCDGYTVLGTGGLSALERAFAALGWDDPHGDEQEE